MKMINEKIKELLSKKYVLYISYILSLFGVLAHAILGQFWDGTSGHAIGSDDAYISFKYSENLIQGNGLVFNLGERVEGYSNFLYTVLLSPAVLLGKDYIYPFSVLINCIFLLISLNILWTYTKNNISITSANIIVLLLSLNPWVWINAGTGLETILVLFVTVGIWISTENYLQYKTKKFIYLLLLFNALSILTRVDGFIFPLLSVFYLLIKNANKVAIKVLLWISLLLLLHMFFRYMYYDDIMPNTFYNKISGTLLGRVGRGLDFVSIYIYKTGLFIGIVSIYYFLLKKDSELKIIQKISLHSLFLIIWVIYLIYIGGDIYYERFFVPIIPLIMYAGLVNIQYFRWQHTLILICLLLLLPFYSASKDSRFVYINKKYDMWISLGKFLGKLPQDTSLAIDAAGKVPFYSGLQIIDMLGLNDKYIGKMKVLNTGIPGHEKFDANYVLSRSPSYIAAWINPDLNMAWGLVNDKYIKHYKIQYLVNSTRNDYGVNNIIDVSKFEDLKIKNLIQNGHNYAVIKRNDTIIRDIDSYSQLENMEYDKNYNHNSDKLFFDGWSHAEEQHRWTLGYNSRIIFKTESTQHPLDRTLKIKFFTLGEQKISINLNGVLIYTNQFSSGNQLIEVKVSKTIINNGLNSLHFSTPTAKQPNAKDERYLALAITSLSIE